MVTFYHYTDPDSAKAIIKSGVIRKSTRTPTGDDAVMGIGVYLTTISPKTAKKWIALNNYDGAILHADRMLDEGKVDAYIKLELDPADLEDCSEKLGRDVYLYRDKDLVIKPYMKAQLGYTD